MSRIGKAPIGVPKGVSVNITDNNTIAIKGPKGEMKWQFPEAMKVSTTGETVTIERPDDTTQNRTLHGLTRSIIANMVTGVGHGYHKVLEISGVGYRAQVQGKKLIFTLGYSHPVEFALPEGIQASVDQKQTQITLTGIDKQLLGQVAADIRALRKPNIYKGKGIRYAGERIKLKVGKAGKK